MSMQTARVFRLTPDNREFFQIFVDEPISEDATYIAVHEDGYVTLTSEEFVAMRGVQFVVPSFMMMTYYPIEFEV